MASEVGTAMAKIMVLVLLASSREKLEGPEDIIKKAWKDSMEVMMGGWRKGNPHYIIMEN